MARFTGKVALVTGAAQGQGRAHALAFAAEGADLIVVDVCRQLPGVGYEMGTAAGLAETVELAERHDVRVVPLTVDVRDGPALRSGVADAVAQLGRLDVIVANAAVGNAQAWDEVTDEVWDLLIGVNLTGVWNTVSAGLPHVVAAGGGAVILISSAAAGNGAPFLLPYVAAKSGVIGIGRSLANELGGSNVRVNVILPGGVETAMAGGSHVQMVPLLEAHPELRSSFAPVLPVTYMQPGDISATVLFLASDEGRYITGVTLPVDAGTVNR